jgi:hypothetical protein
MRIQVKSIGRSNISEISTAGYCGTLPKLPAWVNLRFDKPYSSSLQHAYTGFPQWICEYVLIRLIRRIEQSNGYASPSFSRIITAGAYTDSRRSHVYAVLLANLLGISVASALRSGPAKPLCSGSVIVTNTYRKEKYLSCLAVFSFVLHLVTWLISINLCFHLIVARLYLSPTCYCSSKVFTTEDFSHSRPLPFLIPQSSYHLSPWSRKSSVCGSKSTHASIVKDILLTS